MSTALTLPPAPPDGGGEAEPTKQVQLSEKALELRRRVEARRQEARDQFRKESELVIYRQQTRLKRQVILQQEAHGAERLVDADLLQNHHLLFKRSGHQFRLGEKYERLGRDTQRALRAARENQSKLTYLEGRIRKLKDDVNGVPRGHADAEVDKLKKESRDDLRQLGFRKFFQQCDKCGARVTREHFDGHARVCPGAPPELGNSSDEDPSYRGETEECVVCGLTKPRDKIKAHVKRCKKRQQYIRDRKQASKSVQMKPQPPRDLRIGKITATTIELKWAPPILDGGATVFEYEVVFSMTSVTKVGKKINKVVTEQPPISTTCYMYSEPVCEYGYVLDGLRADTEYSDFRVRGRNAVGWSSHGEPLGVCETKPPVPPGVPLFLHHDEPTAKSFTLSWSAPLRDGGSDVIDYHVHYTEVRKLTNAEWLAEFNPSTAKGAKQTKGDSDQKHEVRNDVSLRVGNASTEYTLRDLRGETDYCNIKIVARTKADLDSAPALIAKVTTAPPSMRDLLVKEIQRVQSVEGDFVDTEFYTGFVQREYKPDYLARLKADLAEAYAAENEARDVDEETKAEHKARWKKGMLTTFGAKAFAESAPEPEAEIDEETLMERAVPDYGRKRRQFEHRLKALEQGISKAEEDQIKCFADRAALARSMADTQNRVIEVRAEIDRVANVKAPYINSAVIHGTTQRYNKPQLQHDLQLEQERCLGLIANAKRRVQQLDAGRVRASQTCIKKKQELHERQAQFVNVRADARRQARVAALQTKKRKLTPKEIRALQQKCRLAHFELWQDYIEGIQVSRKIALKCLKGCAKRFKKNVWHRWRFGTFAVGEEETPGSIIGLGGRLLKVTQTSRAENEDDARQALKELSTLRSSVARLAYTKRQQNEWRNAHKSAYATSELEVVPGEEIISIEKGDDASTTSKRYEDENAPEVAFLLEGDGLRRAGKHEFARDRYTKCLEALTVRAKDRPHGQSDVAALARCMLHIGETYMAEKEFGKCLASVDRASALAQECADSVDIALRGGGVNLNPDDSRLDAGRVLLEKVLLDRDKARACCKTLLGRIELVRGQALVEVSEYQQGQVLLERALSAFERLGDVRAQRECALALAECFRRQHRPKEDVERMEAFALKVDSEVRTKLDKGSKALKALRDRLVMNSAKQGKVVHLQRESARALRLVHEQVGAKKRIANAIEERKEQEKKTQKVEELFLRIEDQIKEAKASDKDEMESMLVHGRAQMFEIEELKIRLQERLLEVQREVKASKAEEQASINKVKNYQDDIQEALDEHAVEAGPLMKKVLESSKFRFIALCATNMKGNEVMGGASGGVGMCVAAESKNVIVFWMKNGHQRRVFTGDDSGRHLGDPEGHTALVSALHFTGSRVFSGGMDGRIFIWDTSETSLNRTITGERWDLTEEERRGAAGWPLRLLEGHEASVTAIAVDTLKVVSGGADCKVILWSRSSGARLRILHGHARSILCLEIGPLWIVSGGQESEARIWHLPDQADPSKSIGNDKKTKVAEDALKRSRDIKTRKKLASGDGFELEAGPGLTCVKYGALELIGGLADGHLVVWWLQDGKILQKVKAHKGPVHDLQFDATRIVSAGGDGLVVVTDITTGELMQSLRGHEGPVLALQFDTEKIVSAGVDNTLRQWLWASESDRGKVSDKFHVYDAGDTLIQIARQHGVSLPDVIRWNAIEDVRKLYPGTRLIVQPGDPDEPTAPEKALAKRQASKRRRNQDVASQGQARKAGAAKDLSTLEKLKAREREGDRMNFRKGPLETAPEPWKNLLDLRYVDRATFSSRIATKIEPSSIDVDIARVRRERSDPLKIGRLTALGGRVAKAIMETIDPFGDVAEERKRVQAEAAAAQEKEEKDEATAAAQSQGKSEDNKLLTLEAKREVANALFILEELLLPGLLQEEVYDLAETEARKVTWDESLTGRFDDSIQSGPIDYDALELLLHQERMKAARLHAAEQRQMEEDRKTGDGSALQAGFSIGNIALSAQRGATDTTVREEQDERYSQADSQDEVDTLLSSDWGEAY